IDTGTYLFQKGGASYADLLSEAQRRYHDVDAVVNVTVDQKKSDYLFVLYSKRTYTLTGIAIRYDKPNQVSTVSTPKPAAGTTQPVSQSSAQITDIGSNYFVTQVTGKAEWFHGGAWGNIKIGDSFTRDTLINTYAYSSIVISDGTKIITTIGANQSGSISAFLNN
ncbi:MAG: hypothetical protein FWF29_10040, partial [Treponema sp.]|nr:hypothetical protein [Treponema sp.]